MTALQTTDRVVRYLGLSKNASPLALVNAVDRGLPMSGLDSFARRVAPDDASFKYRFVTKPTYARRAKASKSAQLSSEESDRLMRVVGVFAFAEEVWGDLDGAAKFMSAAHPLLEGERPLDVALRNDLGARLVEDILGRLAFGAAV